MKATKEDEMFTLQLSEFELKIIYAKLVGLQLVVMPEDIIDILIPIREVLA